MKFFLIFLHLLICTTTNASAATQSSSSYYLDYGTNFQHPLYQVQYKIVSSKTSKNPRIFLFLCGRGMSLEMYQEWAEKFVTHEAGKSSRGVIIYLMNFPGQIVLEKDHIPAIKQNGWQGILRHKKQEAVRKYRATIRSYDEYIRAVNAMISVIYERHRTPVILSGHSMGGHIALRYVLHLHQAVQLDTIAEAENYLKVANSQPMALELSRSIVAKYKIHTPSDLIKGVVLVMPMLDIDTGAVPGVVANVMASAATFIGLGGAYVPGYSDYDPARDSFHKDTQTTCEHGYNKLKELRTQYGVPMVTYAWLKATFASINYLKSESFADFTLPVLTLLASQEKIVKNNEAREMVARINGSVVKEFPCMHTPFVEKEEIQQTLMDEVSSFIHAHS